MINSIIKGTEIKWISNSSFKIKNEDLVIYINPFNIKGRICETELADIILITNENPQTCDPESIRNVRTHTTTTLLPENMSLQFKGDARRVEAGDELVDEMSIKGVPIQVLPSFASHSTTNNGVGYILTFGNKLIYHAGLTDSIPQMKNLLVDIIIIPIWLCNTEMFNILSSVKSQIIIPVYYMHKYNDFSIQSLKDNINSKFPNVEIIMPQDLK